MTGDDELSRMLRELRHAVGLSSTAAADAAGIGQAALSRYETGRFVPTPARLDALLAVYQPPDAVRERLHAIVTDLRAESRRVVVHRRGAPAFQRRIRDIEASSSHVTTFQPTVVPGILQTPAYMRALTAGVDPAIAEGVIAARLERQALLGAPGHRFSLIITAGALLWCAADAATMVEQIDHILAASRLDGVRVGVIPARHPATVSRSPASTTSARSSSARWPPRRLSPIPMTSPSISMCCAASNPSPTTTPPPVRAQHRVHEGLLRQ